MKIFIDAGAFLALEIQNDQNHLLAKRYFNTLKNKRALFFTNDYVLDEAYTRLIYDLHLNIAYTFHKYISQLLKENQLSLLEVEPAVREKAWHELLKFSEHKLSFTDGVIIVHFRKYHLDEIFTFDRHFRNINLPTNLL